MITAREACGTTRGYAIHWKRSEQVCFECLRAMSAHRRELRAAVKRRAVLAEAISRRGKRT